ncbi:MAG: hypothetical protein RMM29_06415 [Planctomycetota bacterium]|nr:hypothetical protein [Planctomycetota bacterium]
MANGPLGQDEIDRLLAEMGISEEGQASSPAGSPPSPGSAPPPASTASPAVPDSGQRLGQDDIDRLLNELNPTTRRLAAAASAAAAPAAGGAAAAPPPGPLAQDDIDRLLAELGVAEPAAAVTAQTPTPAREAVVASSTAQDAAAPGAGAAAAAAPPAAAAGGKLAQDDIDRLLAELGAEPPAATSKAAPATTAATASKTAQIASSSKAAPAAPSSAPTAAASEGPLTQDDIDRLLAELGAAAPAATSKAAPATTAATASKTAQVASSSKAAPAVPSSAPTAAAPEGPLTQDDIDRLLAELGAAAPAATSKAAPATTAAAANKTAPAATDAPAGRPTRVVPPAPPPVEPRATKTTQELSPAEVEAIVAKHATAAPAGADSEVNINQAEIDALVKQLAQATGSPEAAEVAQAIVGKAQDIERLQAEAAPAAPTAATRDAVDVVSVLTPTATTSTAPQALHPPVATITTVEWRAARWLLIAALLLLGMCAGALIVLTLSVSGLTRELRAAREVERPTLDGYADRVRLAIAQLQSADEAERARAVRWLEDLRIRYPERAADTALVLARYFRDRQAWRRASEEYALALEAGSDDPLPRLEFVDCLMRLGDEANALRQIYAILAEEARWLADRDAQGRPIPDATRRRQVIAEAYVLLGRLLSGQTVAASGGQRS